MPAVSTTAKGTAALLGAFSSLLADNAQLDQRLLRRRRSQSVGLGDGAADAEAHAPAHGGDLPINRKEAIP